MSRLDGAALAEASHATSSHTQWLYEKAVQSAYRLRPEILDRQKYWPSILGWSLNIFAGAALAYQKRVAADLPPWT